MDQINNIADLMEDNNPKKLVIMREYLRNLDPLYYGSTANKTKFLKTIGPDLDKSIGEMLSMFNAIDLGKTI